MQYISNGLTLMVVTLLVLTIAYRYYSAFLAAKVFALDPARKTPAHRLNDKHNYVPTNKWVLFGHHFAAIAGAGPLIGPVLAAQFGYLPGFLWILIGVVLAGAVQDFTILVLSTRRDGKSLAQIAFHESGPAAGTAATIGILFVLVIALAGLGKVVTKALGGDTIRYPTGTRFTEPLIPNPDSRPGQPKLVSGGIFPIPATTPPRWRIPAETIIRYPTGGEETTGTRMEIVLLSDDPNLAANVQTIKNEKGEMEMRVTDEVAVVRQIAGSTWGTFTIALSIPIALFVGWYIYRLRKGKILEGSIIGGVLVLLAVYAGGILDGYGTFAEGGMMGNIAGFLQSFREDFNLSEHQIGIAMAVYGFLAAILPVWVLLCPRDYLSSFLKIGTVGLLVIGVIIAHPTLHAPAINWTFVGGGPAFNGALFPFVFIVIMCGAVSGFHALVSSGTTPKMLDNETHARAIGYGAMLIEGLVAVLALIAACALPTAHYYHIQTSYQDLPKWQQQIVTLVNPADRPQEMSEMVGENVQGRTSGAVTLAVGMATIFDNASKNVLGYSAATIARLEGMMKYWYHFAIMFEALFILTTIDTGTRVGRFLLQETMGKWIHPTLGKTDWWPSALAATGIMVFGWWYFLEANSMGAIWPMFGIANQMLAVMALAIGTAALVRMGKGKYAWTTAAPMCFVIVTTTTAAVIMLIGKLKVMGSGAPVSEKTNAAICALCILVILTCTATIVIASLLATRRGGGGGMPDDGTPAMPDSATPAVAAASALEPAAPPLAPNETPLPSQVDRGSP